MFRVALGDREMVDNETLKNVSRITTLTKLDINFTRFSLKPILDALLENHIKLYSLQTNYAMFSERTFDSLCKMQSLRELIILNTLGVEEMQIKRSSLNLKSMDRFSFIKTGITGKCLLDIVERSKTLSHGEFRLQHGCIINFNLCECLSELIEGNKRNFKLYVHKNDGYIKFTYDSKYLKLLVTRHFNANKSVLAKNY